MKVVAAVIRSKEGLILVAQRGKGMHFEGKWEFPGGKVKENESPQQALKREIMEELCLDIEVGKLALEWSYEYSFGKVNFMAYNSQVIKGHLHLVEHMAFKWLNVKDLKELEWVPADLTLVEQLIGGKA